MRPATVVVLAVLLLALFGAGIYQLFLLPASGTGDTVPGSSVTSVVTSSGASSSGASFSLIGAVE